MDDRGLWEVLSEIPDRRGRKGRQYPLSSLLGISLAAMLAGANDLRAIFRWGRRLRPEALAVFGIRHGKAPCHATYHYFFASLDGDAVARRLGRGALDEERPGHIAIKPAPDPDAGTKRCAALAAMARGGCMCSRPMRLISAR